MSAKYEERCPRCQGKGTVVKYGPHRDEYDSHYPCPRCTTDRTALKVTGPARELGRLCTRCWQGLSPLERSLLAWEAEPVADATWELLRALAELPAFDGPLEHGEEAA